ncbi:hypothetical protein GZH47_16820 [Paenibacillus rhizovicinus]|uniref:Uncharacterized protein n=1 Tax=Paenibacillus rhizovicinus TaxID=2704463 RepID=A0A6C0P1F1_9BACL|nr:hypothetical protein [Paenibacillus rhizovicinus]QHW32305.1 hypothetical protein GZH47_16820 [Paenibacillus rhizovicinus]
MECGTGGFEQAGAKRRNGRAERAWWNAERRKAGRLGGRRDGETAARPDGTSEREGGTAEGGTERP